MRSGWIGLGLIGLLLVMGCGDSTNYVPVSGIVTLDEKPVPNAMVIFQPMAKEGSDAGGVGSSGKTDEQGRYTLEAMTKTPRKGALVGRHRVRIGSVSAAATGNQDSDAAFAAKEKKHKDIIPDIYNVNSTLEIEVPPGGLDNADFKLSSRGAKKN